MAVRTNLNVDVALIALGGVGLVGAYWLFNKVGDFLSAPLDLAGNLLTAPVRLAGAAVARGGDLLSGSLDLAGNLLTAPDELAAAAAELAGEVARGAANIAIPAPFTLAAVAGGALGGLSQEEAIKLAESHDLIPHTPVEAIGVLGRLLSGQALTDAFTPVVLDRIQSFLPPVPALPGFDVRTALKASGPVGYFLDLLLPKPVLAAGEVTIPELSPWMPPPITTLFGRPATEADLAGALAEEYSNRMRETELWSLLGGPPPEEW